MRNYFKQNTLQILISVIFIATTFILMFSLYRSNFIKVKYDNIPLRTSNSPFASQKEVLQNGDEIEIKERKNGWYKVLVNADEKTGWVASWLLEGKNTDPKNTLREMTIFLDAGHGGWDSGSLSDETSKNPNDFEKTYTLKYILALGKKLEDAGVQVNYTRKDDTYVDFKQVGSIATNDGSNLLVSIHFDSSEQTNEASGITQYYWRLDNNSKLFSTSISNQLNNLGVENRGVRRERFAVVANANIPAVLLEMGYINTESDFKLIKSDAYQKKAVNDVYNGILDYVNSQVQKNNG